MRKNAVILFLLLTLSSLAETFIPSSAQKYLEVLQKRPQPGAVFERFYTAWLEEGTAAGLLDYLSTQAARADASVKDHLILALFHTHRGDDREALSAYHAALRLDPKNTSAWLERARIETRLLDYPAALVSLDQAAALNPPESLALDISKLKGRALLRLGKNDEALGIWHQMLAQHAGNEDLTEEIIDLFADEAQYEAAIGAAQALVKKSRDPLARTLRQLRLADILLMADRRDESIAMLDTALAATGAETWIEGDVLGRIERLFRMSDDIAGLEKHFAELVQSHPQRVTLAWQHVLLQAGAGQQEAALKQARTLLQANPGRQDLHDGFLDLLDSLNQIEEALAQAQALSLQHPEDKELLIRLASLQQRSKNRATAVSTLEKYLTVTGADEASLLRVARFLEGWESSPAKVDSHASKAYQRLASSFPDSMSAQEACAHFLHRNQRRDEALAIWRRLAKTAGLEDVLRIAQSLQARLESRPALDILIAREADFPRHPRFLKLLVQTAIANEEFERALPWALTSLHLMHDVEGIEDAMAPLRTLLRPEHAKLAAPLMEELEEKVSPMIQDRCLLSMLLHNKGDAVAAEQMLMDAAGADKLIALDQLTKLQQAGKNWQAAARTLQQLIAIPNARTPARLQLLVDLLRRANQPAQALEQIPAWKMLTPSAIEPWLVEARVLGELYRDADALKVLRQAARKFPDAAETAHAYATACLNAGDAAEAERIYLSLYEKTTDNEARLRLLPPLVLAAQQHQALPHLVENFQRRQQQNRASAFPWLALAEIHRAASNSDEHLRCLYEASRLRPQDLGLLLETARHEEKQGLYPEAIRTLEAAAKLDKTTKVRERLAKLQIENGDPDAGYRILFELAGGGQMSLDAIEQIADAMALRGDWKNVPPLLLPLLEKHPQHYRLHYLCGVAQEEGGQENAALITFLRVMDMHEEIPGTLPASPPEDIRSLPAGTEDWLRFASSSAIAYAYQQRVKDLQYAWRQSVSAPPSLISLPPDVLQAPAFALAHVLRIASDLPESEQQRILTQLRRLGVAEAAMLLEAASDSSGIAITPELLAANPANAALHSAWLLSPADTLDLPALERCFELLKDRHPELAIVAAYEVLQRELADNSETWVRRLIKICSSLPRANHREWEPLAWLLWSQFPELNSTRGDPVIYLTAEETEEITSILHRWMLENPRLESVREIATVLVAHERWDAAFDGFQRMVKLAAVSGTPQPMPPTRLACLPHRPWNTAPFPLKEAGTGMPSSIIEVLDPMLASLHEEVPVADENNMLRALFQKAPVGEEKQRVEKFQAAMRHRIAGVHDEQLRLFLQLLCGEARTLLTEQEHRIHQPEATVRDFLFAGWLHQFLDEDEKALRMFQSAAKRTQDGRLLEHLDSACLFLAMRLQSEGRSELASEAARPVLDRILKHPLTTEEKNELLPFLEEFGLKEDAENLMRSMPGTHLAMQKQSASPNTQNPYSNLLSSGKRGSAQDLLDRLLLQDNDTGALAEAFRRVRRLAALWVSDGHRSDGTGELTTLLLKLGMHELRQPFLAQLKADAETDWEKRQDYAALLEMQHAHGRVFPNNDGASSLTLEELHFRAVQEYEAVLKASPHAHGARRRLVMLLACKDAAAALRHWAALPETMQSAMLSSLIDLGRHEQKPDQVTALARFITLWVKTLDPDRPITNRTKDLFGFILKEFEQGNGWPSLQEVFGPVRPADGISGWEFDANGVLKLDEDLRRQRNDRRIAYDALCRAMIRLPELAEMGFAPLSGLALFEQRDLAGMEQLALQVLSLRASRPAMRRQAATRQPPAGDGRLFESDSLIANQPSAFFATCSAARRRDVPMLENVIYPAILKADGQPMVDFCRGYAEMILAGDGDFSAAATAWVKRWVKVTEAYAAAFHSGGMVHEVVRLWEARSITAPLDDLFLAYKDMSISPRDAMDNNPLVLAPTPYVCVLLKRDPAELRRFLLRMREEWISPDADVRRQAMAHCLANEARRSAHRNTPTERAAGSCLEWLKYLMKTEGSQAAFEAAAEDGALNAKEWVETYAEQKDEIQTPGEFMILLRQLGYLRGDKGLRLLTDRSAQPGQALRLALQFRDSGETKDGELLVALLGRHQPASLDTHLLQAMFVLEEIKSIHLDGRPVTLTAPPSSGPLTRREMAYRLVILRHATEIAAMSVQERNALGAFLRLEQPRLLRPSPDDAELIQALEPVIQATKQDSVKPDTQLETRKP